MTARKAQAAQACIDRFAGKAYAPGKRDCARLACHLLHKIGKGVPFLKGHSWTTEAGAVRVLRRLGFADIMEAVDALGLERIAPARAMAGDIVALPAEGPFGCALTVAVGNGRLLGFLEGRCQVVEPKAFVAAWRV